MSKPSAAISLSKIAAPGAARRTTVNLEPLLAAELDGYVKAYAEAYGETVELDALIPHILQNFILNDKGYKRWKAAAAKPE